MATVVMIQPREAPARFGRRTFERMRARLYLLGFGLAMAALRIPVQPGEPRAHRTAGRPATSRRLRAGPAPARGPGRRARPSRPTRSRGRPGTPPPRAAPAGAARSTT